MAMLVEQQDETIVNVEGQAQGVDSDVKAGYVCCGHSGASQLMDSLQQTEKAVASARAARRKKWISFWICRMFLF